MRRNPHQLTLPLLPTTYQLYQSPVMSHSNLHDGAPFQFLSSCVAGETISPWDCRKFPCAHADSTVTYPTDTEVGEADPFPFWWKLINFHHRSAWWWPMGMFIWGGSMVSRRLSGGTIHWQTPTTWMLFGVLWSEWGSNVVCWFRLI